MRMVSIRCLVTENGVRPGAQQRAPEFSPPGGRAVERGVNTPVHDLPAPGAHLSPDALVRQAGLDGLPDGQYSALAIK
jgi:hypothetical protein